MTTSTIMRSKQTPSSVGRPLFNIRHYYTNGAVHPQWMRSLEEKYQRIHTKIAQSTTAMSNLYNSTLGRTNIQDKQLLRATLSEHRREYITPTKLNSVTSHQRKVQTATERVNPRSKLTATKISETPVNTCNARQEKTPPVAPQNSVIELNSDDENCDDVQDDIGEDAYEDIEDDDGESTDEDEEILNDIEVEEIREREVNSSPQNPVAPEDISQTLTNAVPLVDTSVNTADKVKTHSPQTNKSPQVQKGYNRTPFITQLGSHYQHGRLMRRERAPRTSTSRRSIQTHKTAKSCPATMEHVDSSVYLIQKSETDMRAKSAHKCTKNQGQRHLNLFSRMSMEAQHALTETRKEVKPENGPDSRNSRCSFPNKVSNGHVDVSDGHLLNVQQQVHGIGLSSVINNGVLCDVELPEKAKENRLDASDVSGSVGNSNVNVFSNKTKLPNIGEGGVTSLQQLQNFKGAVPGVLQNQYQYFGPKRESTFEITPPGYDIRYKEMMVLEERESETPPPDIKERAVQKCQDWLSRYTPR